MSSGAASSVHFDLPPIRRERTKKIPVPAEIVEHVIEVPHTQHVERIEEISTPKVKTRWIPTPKFEVKERLIEIPKHVIEEKVIEIPEIEWVEKIVEVPQYVYKERIIEVPKPVIHEKIISLPDPSITERTMYDTPGDYYNPTPVQEENDDDDNNQFINASYPNEYKHTLSNDIPFYGLPPYHELYPEQEFISYHTPSIPYPTPPALFNSFPYSYPPSSMLPAYPQPGVPLPSLNPYFLDSPMYPPWNTQPRPIYRHIPRYIEVPITQYRPIPIERIIDKDVSVPVELEVEQEFLRPRIIPKYIDVAVDVPINDYEFPFTMGNSSHYNLQQPLTSSILLDAAARQHPNLYKQGLAPPPPHYGTNQPGISHIWHAGPFPISAPQLNKRRTGKGQKSNCLLCKH